MSDPWAETYDGELIERLSVASGAMMFVVNLKPRTLWVNEALVENTGYTFEDYHFERFENPFIPPDDLAQVMEALGRFLQSDDGVSEVIRNRFTDRWGGTLHVRSRITKIKWKGEPALLYTTFLDEEARGEVLEREQRYRSLVESATDSIVRLAPDLTIQYSNRCFQGLVGREPQDLSDLKFTDLVVEDQRAAVTQQFVAGPETVLLSAQLAGPEGTAVWLEGTFVRTRRGNDAGMLHAILRDTTEKRRLDARVQLAQQRETLAQLAGGIAHDLNNILTGILGSATLVEQARAQGHAADAALADIRLAAKRAGELSSSMLAYAGEGNVQRVPVDLAALVEEMKPLLASALEKNVGLTVTTTGTATPVLGDEVQLRQVIMNLIINAADASQPGGGVVVVTSGVRTLEAPFPGGQYAFGEVPAFGPVAFVRVEDQGKGMAPEVLARIFDPFFSTKAKGRGLGLAAVLGILGRHGGCVLARSEEGVGTTMEILLPLTQAPLRAAAPVPHAPQAVRGSGAILVVDDEVMIRRIARRAFEPLGYRVLEADSGEEALEVLAAHGPEVRAVVLDQTMPGMGGVKALERIRVNFPSLPVVRTSGYTAETGSPQSDVYTCFLGKPFGAPQLIAAVQKAIGDA